jgi:hypothetical protein
MNNSYDAGDILDGLTRAIDRKGCDGLTIWLAPDGRLQIGMRDKQTQGWTIALADELDEGLSRVTKDFLNGNRNDIRRVVTVSKKRRREISDLI